MSAVNTWSVPAPFELATAWRRLAARAVDLLILFAMVGLLPPILNSPKWLALAVLFYGLPPVLGHSVCGKTPGKALLGIRVVANSGRNPGLFRSLARWLAEAVPALAMVAIAAAILLVGFFSAWGEGDSDLYRAVVPLATVVAWWFPVLNLTVLLIGRQNKAIHDFAAGTWVVRG